MTGEENAVWKAFDDLKRQLFDLLDNVRSQSVEALGAVAMSLHQLDVALQVFRDSLPKVFNFLNAFESSSVDKPNLQEDKVLEMSTEDPQNGKEHVETQSTEAVDEDDSRILCCSVAAMGIGQYRSCTREMGWWVGRQEGVQSLEEPPRAGVVAVDEDRRCDQRGRDDKGQPAALMELDDEGHRQDEAGQQKADAVDEEPMEPCRLPMTNFPPVLDHPELGEGEDQEHVDTVQDDQKRDGPTGQPHQEEGGRSHDQDPILGDQPVAEQGEAGRHPAVQGHIGQDPGAVQKTRLSRHEEDHSLGDEGRQDEGPAGGDFTGQPLEQDGVQGLACLRLDPIQQIRQDESASDEGQAGRHVQHRPLARLDPGLPQDGETVTDSLDTRVGAAPQAVGVEQEEENPCQAHLGDRRLQFPARLLKDRRQVAQVAGDGLDDSQGVSDDKQQEYRDQGQDRLPDPPQVQDRQKENGRQGHGQFVAVPGRRQKAEDGIDAAGDGDRDRQDIVDQEGTTGHHADGRGDQLPGDQITPAACREQLDDLDIAGADDEYGQGRHDRQEDGQVGMPLQGQEGLLRPVTGRRDAVGSQTDPGQEGDEGDLVEDARLRGLPGRAEDDALETLG